MSDGTGGGRCSEWKGMGCWGAYQLIGFLECPLCLAYSRLSRLTGQVWDLVEFLGQVGLDDLELGLVAVEEAIVVEEVGHDGQRRAETWGKDER